LALKALSSHRKQRAWSFPHCALAAKKSVFSSAYPSLRRIAQSHAMRPHHNRDTIP
jgi:hypothetical protein